MSTQPLPFTTPEQYLAVERQAEFRSEYINGEVFAMAGGTFNHMMVVANTGRRLMEQLDGKPCFVASQDLKLYCSKPRVMTYPDVIVHCGQPKFFDKRRDVITDATLIAEVLSPSTSKYDRTDKFDYYQSLDSFTEYLLIYQDRMLAELHTRQPDSSWLSRRYAEANTEIALQSIGCRVNLGSLYERVEFDAENG